MKGTAPAAFGGPPKSTGPAAHEMASVHGLPKSMKQDGASVGEADHDEASVYGPPKLARHCKASVGEDDHDEVSVSIPPKLTGHVQDPLALQSVSYDVSLGMPRFFAQGGR